MRFSYLEVSVHCHIFILQSSDRELLDYTVHEVHRYGELLLAGDHRCVETLFLHDTSYIKSSDALEQLIQKRNLFLNR
jgi:hypothetical protein